MPRRFLTGATAAAAVTAAVLMAGGGQAVAAGASPASPPASACSATQVIHVDGMAFQPAEVAPGGSSEATVALTNCTGVDQTVSGTWTGQWLSNTTSGPAAGCPIIDPVAVGVDLAPYAQGSSGIGYTVPTGCQADVLRVTVTLRVGATQVGQDSADLVIEQPSVGG